MSRSSHSRVPRLRLAAIGTLAVAATGLGVLLPTGVAAAATPLHGPIGDVIGSQTYHCTGSTVSVPVPAGAFGMRFTAIGGAGGEGGGSSVAPGLGAQISGGVLVKGGDVVNLTVGQQGGDGNDGSAGAGGWGADQGGASGAPTAPSKYAGGGGGGATAVTLDSHLLAVAGGGGGKGGAGFGTGSDAMDMYGGQGGNAGQTAGNGGSGYAVDRMVGGNGGTGGAPYGSTGRNGTDGTAVSGGGANGAGGGGGGGYVAGGGGGSIGSGGAGGGGGGAGASYTADGLLGSLTGTATSEGNGSVQIQWYGDASIDLTTASSTVTASRTAVRFDVTGTDTDGTSLGDVSKYVRLSSSEPTDVVSGSGVEMTTAGTRTITATWIGAASITSKVDVTVSPAAPSQIVIEGAPKAMPANLPLQLGAEVTDQFGNNLSEVTSKASWSSDVPSDVWQGSQVTMSQTGEHKITVSVPGYPTSSVVVGVTPAS